MEKLIYLDNAATTALKPEVLEKMMREAPLPEYWVQRNVRFILPAAEARGITGR